MQCLSVVHQTGAYPIAIGHQLLNQAELFPVKAGEKVMIVTNDTIAPFYLSTLSETLKNKGCTLHYCLLPDGEAHKNFASLDLIYNALLEHNFGRDGVLVALGGGVVGDIVGFAAATYQRGIRFIQVPTTLLAQVDSSVGGKTAINHPKGKNMIGAFYQPQAVIIDLDTLNTLPAREFSAGLAEVIKYGAGLDKYFFHWLEENLNAVMKKETEALLYTVYRCCQLKQQIVSRDEKEQGERALLNLGHTFGHAIETHQGFGKVLHGEAVAMGMMLASELSLSLPETNWTKDNHQALKTLLQQTNLPTSFPKEITHQDFLSLMQKDKKVLANKLRLILFKALGKTEVVTFDNIPVLFQTFDKLRG